jgi:hypothetical protein
MNTNKFEYELGLSFLSEVEPIAKNIYSELIKHTFGGD